MNKKTLLEWFFYYDLVDYLWILTLIYFQKMKNPELLYEVKKWKKKWKQRTDDYGIESITNCLYVKCKAKKYYEHRKKNMNYKNSSIIAFFQIWYHLNFRAEI